MINEAEIKELEWQYNGQHGTHLGGIGNGENRITIFEVRPKMSSKVEYEVYNCLSHFTKIADKVTLEQAKNICQNMLIELVGMFYKQ